jgi:hypothetical protein
MSDAQSAAGSTPSLDRVSAPAVARMQHKCRRCSHWRPVEEFVAGGPVSGYCLGCYERHHEALRVLAGALPTSCVLCDLSFSALREACAPADPRMYLHVIDGLYGLLCPRCSDDYERKRLDLYGATPYGEAKKLRGAK